MNALVGRIKRSSSPREQRKKKPTTMCPSILIMHILVFSLSVVSGTDISPEGNPCSSMAPQTFTVGKPLPLYSLFMQHGYFQTRGENPGQTSYSTSSEVVQSEFYPTEILETSTDGVLYVKGRLLYRTRHTHRLPTTQPYFTRRAFDLTGFWSRADSKLCMFDFSTGYDSSGNDITTFHSVLKLDFKSNPTILTSLISGTLESLDVGRNHFDPVDILGYNQDHYNYTLASRASDPPRFVGGSVEEERGLSLGFESNKTMCSIMRSLQMWYELEYGTSCGVSTTNCNPLGKGHGFLPRFMEMNVVGCTDEGKLNMYLTFSNNTFYGRTPPFLPDSVLLGEGLWDWERNRLRVTACRIMNSSALLTDSYVGDCSVRMSLGFRETLSIRNRSDAAGEIWSTKTKNESDYFEPISFRSVGKSVKLSLKYEYTMVNLSKDDCALKENGGKSHNTYPDPALYASDLRVITSVRGSGKSSSAHAYFAPLFLGDRALRRNVGMGSTQRFGAKLHGFPQKLWNISYAIGFISPTNSKWIEFLSFQTSKPSNYGNYRKISAEGVYNSDTGLLCMVGCRYLPTNYRNLSAKFDRYDCEISINLQFPPVVSDPSSEAYLNGSIRSKRNHSDPLYFQPLVVTSHIRYSGQFRRMAKRMDFEFVMVIVSLTLTCVFVASQLLYAKRHPETLPSVSISILGILTLGLMIPLVLNFEALFVGKNVNRGRRSAVMFRTGGWLEAKEVVVRALTMVAFLLQFRLLQLTVSSKSAQQGWWSPEGRVLKWCVPLYSAGGLIALLLHFQKSSTTPEPHHSLWEYLLSYAGLVLDWFLLPQVLFSLFSRSKGKVLAVSFYVGMTLVRSLPHAYDAYRARYYRTRFRDSYLYADHRRDFYSAAWDVAIPCGGVVLSVLTFVQQKFGGSSLVPPRFRRLAGYEEVPGVDGAGSTSEVELQ